MHLEGQPPEPGEIRTAVESVLGQPGFLFRARELQQELKQLPPLAQAVNRLEMLAETKEPQVYDRLM